MNVIVRQAKAHEHGRDSEHLLKCVNHGNRSSGTNEHRQRIKTFLVGERRRANSCAVAVDQSGFDWGISAHRAIHGCGSNALDVVAKKPCDFVRILIGNQPDT